MKQDIQPQLTGCYIPYVVKCGRYASGGNETCEVFSPATSIEMRRWKLYVKIEREELCAFLKGSSWPAWLVAVSAPAVDLMLVGSVPRLMLAMIDTVSVIDLDQTIIV